MILLALVVAAAAPAPKPVPKLPMAPLPVVAASPADAIASAERAFARRAQNEGQWKAFRAFATPDALMFVPTVKPVAQILAGAPEPLVPVMWWPGTIAPSCDGTLGVSTGPWVRAASGGIGTFTTVWRKTANGYRWQLDHGRPTPKLVVAGDTPSVISPACGGATDASVREAAYEKLAASMAASAGAEGASAFAANAAADVLVQGENVMPVRGPAALPKTRFGAAVASGHSDDWTLAWASRALLGGDTGAHDLRVWQWRGNDGWKLVVYETIGIK